MATITKEYDFDIASVANWDRVKSTLVPRLVNKEKNKKMIENIPYKEFLDLAVIFTALVTINGQKYSLPVRNEYLLGWGRTVEEVEAAAMKNAPKLLPVNYPDVLKILKRVASRDGVVFDEEKKKELLRKTGYTIVSNAKKCYGASVILYDGVLEGLAKTIGGNYYILPSSVHEVIAVSEVGQDSKVLSARVASININETQKNRLSPEEVLANHVYYYDASAKELRIA